MASLIFLIHYKKTVTYVFPANTNKENCVMISGNLIEFDKWEK